MSEAALEAFASVDQTLAAVEEHLKVFVEKSVEDFIHELTPIDKAKVQVSLAYSINALLYVYLKTQGVSSKDIRQTHVKQELDRVKTFIKKIKETEELAKGPSLKLDKEASKRFINSALSRDQVYADALEERKKQEIEANRDVKIDAAAETGKQATPTKRATPQDAKAADKKKRRKK